MAIGVFAESDQPQYCRDHPGGDCTKPLRKHGADYSGFSVSKRRRIPGYWLEECLFLAMEPSIAESAWERGSPEPGLRWIIDHPRADSGSQQYLQPPRPDVDFAIPANAVWVQCHS